MQGYCRSFIFMKVATWGHPTQCIIADLFLVAKFRNFVHSSRGTNLQVYQSQVLSDCTLWITQHGWNDYIGRMMAKIFCTNEVKSWLPVQDNILCCSTVLHFGIIMYWMERARFLPVTPKKIAQGRGSLKNRVYQSRYEAGDSDLWLLWPTFDLGSICACFQWTGSTPAGFQKAFRVGSTGELEWWLCRTGSFEPWLDSEVSLTGVPGQGHSLDYADTLAMSRGREQDGPLP